MYTLWYIPYPRPVAGALVGTVVVGEGDGVAVWANATAESIIDATNATNPSAITFLIFSPPSRKTSICFLFNNEVREQ